MKNSAAFSNQRSLAAARKAITVLGLSGMGISSYLTFVHFRDVRPYCLPSTDCHAVLSSSFATIFGLPMALYGLALYSLLTVLGLLMMLRKDGGCAAIPMILYAGALSGTLFSGYLYYLEIFKIHAFCSWCIASSIIMVGILVLSLVNLSGTRRVSGEMVRGRFSKAHKATVHST